MQLTASKLSLFSTASNEWTEDGVETARLIEKLFQGALAFTLDDNFLNGDDVGKPLGVMNAPCLITVAKESGQAAGTIEYKNLTEMFSRLHPASAGRSIWVFHQDTIPHLLELTITIVTGGSHVPVLKESGGSYRILTRPQVFTEKVQTLGDKGDILLADFSQYAIGMRREVRFEASLYLKFQSAETAWRMTMRGDGQPLWNEPLPPKSGANTVGPFITLAART